MNKDSGQPQAVFTTLARRAHRVVLLTWFLVALTPGVAAGMAQYASLAADDPTILNHVALGIVCIGLGAVLVGLVYWGVARSRLTRAGYLDPLPTCRYAFISSASSILMFVLGAVLTTLGGNSASSDFRVIFAFGLGISCLVGGFLGMMHVPLRILLQDIARQRARHALLREEARREGRKIKEPSGALVVLGVLGTVISFFLMLTSTVSGPLLSRVFCVPMYCGTGGMLIIGSVLCFTIFHALLIATYGERTLAPVPQVRTYALLTSTAVTMTFFLAGLSLALGLGGFSLIPLIVVPFVAGMLRRRYLQSGTF